MSDEVPGSSQDRFPFAELAVAPPGTSPLDPAAKEIDAVAFALERSIAMLIWIEEHRASFEAERDNDRTAAERELGHLADATRQAQQYLGRLTDLLLAGYHIDQTKRMPNDILFARRCLSRR